MKRPLAVVSLLLLTAAANAGDLLIFSDAALTDSTLSDTTPATVQLYVVHAGHNGATGTRFAVHASPGYTGVWLGESSLFWTVGDSQTDISIAYGQCIVQPVVVLTMTYQLFGTSEACSALRTGPAAGFLAALCLEGGGCFYETPCKAGALRVNCAVATESTSWGKVKALYRN